MASNFGRISDMASKGDYALGIHNLTFQVIGVMAVLACRLDGAKRVVLTGRLVPTFPRLVGSSTV
jgi:type II pantothenate kinase